MGFLEVNPRKCKGLLRLGLPEVSYSQYSIPITEMVLSVYDSRGFWSKSADLGCDFMYFPVSPDSWSVVFTLTSVLEWVKKGH